MKSRWVTWALSAVFAGSATFSARAAEPAWARPGALVFADGAVGLGIDTAVAEESRRLVIATPASVSVGVLRSAMPRNAEKLMRGEPFTLLAIGDSVTATGPYPEILAKFLARAAGRGEIQVRRAAYPGCSVDAAVRRWDQDAGAAGADLALIMFGLNDQAANSPVEAYLEQIRWLVEELHAQGADVVLLEPTPDIGIKQMPGDRGPPPPEAAIFRVMGFIGALRELGREMGVPVAPTFAALWGEGGTDLQATARAQWPLFPISYRRPFSSLPETAGKGDTIHPNALGHLRMAEAVMRTMTGKTDAKDAPMFSAKTWWADGRLISRLRIENVSPDRLMGRASVYPLPQDDRRVDKAYDLRPGEACEVEVEWPEARAREDVLRWPLKEVFSGAGPFLQVVDQREGRSRVCAVRAAMESNLRWKRERSVFETGTAKARLQVGEELREVVVPLPAGRIVGRIPLRHVEAEEAAVAELVFVRNGSALSGEAEVDGKLGEWDRAIWEPLGEPEQARWTKGPRDFRASLAEFYPNMAFKAGSAGLYVAIRGSGDPGKDGFTLYFDGRPSSELGTAGPYTWIEAKPKEDGALGLRAGNSSSSDSGAGAQGTWRRTEAGGFAMELFVPYRVMNAQAWPGSGDLGFSVVWKHNHGDGRSTYLMWAENGHPWNPRWFGVVRRDPKGAPTFRVRVE